MKIDFERVYFDEESKYLLFRSKPERFYMLRVMDFDGGLRFGKTIKNPEIIESGSGVIGEYLLTKKEFDLWDTDEEAFNALVASISKNAPADRVLKIYYQLSPDAPQNDLEINPGQPTETKTNLVEEMKDMFQKERSASVKKFMDFIYGREDDDIYFIYSGNMNPMFPAIDFEGKMFLAQGEKQAKLITDSTKIFNNKYRKVSSEEAKDIIENCKRYGVYKILFCREDGEAFLLDRDEVLGQPTENKWNTYNSNIYNLIIRCIECANVDNPNIKANQMTLTSELSHSIFKSIFLVAIGMSSEGHEKNILFSNNAKAIYDEENFVFSGGEDYAVENAPEDKLMIRTLVNTQDNTYALPVFTDMTEFTKIFPEGSSIPLAVTAEEFYSMKNEQCNVIILNPPTLGFLFTDEAMNQLRDLSQKPLTMFRPQEAEQNEEKKTTINLPQMPQPSSTEDILNIVANQINRADAVKKENIVKSDSSQKTVEQSDEQEYGEEDEITETEEITEAADNTAEENSSNDDTSRKKGGFFIFSRFKKKNK